ncbi:MAG: AAA family ATPase [Pseudomonadota bacterium]
MQRIMIIGGPGSGKSTLARQLGEKLGLPVTHIDQFQFQAGWVEVDPDTRDAQLRKVIAGPRWIIDGNYSSTAEDRMARADTLIWLDISIWRRLWRVALRTIKHYGKSRPDLPHGCPERFSAEFIRYIIATRKTQRAKAAARFERMTRDAQAFQLRSARDVHSFLGRKG